MTGSPRPNCYDNEEQKARAPKVLSEKLKQGREPDATRAVICRTLGMIGIPRPAMAILAATNARTTRSSGPRRVGRSAGWAGPRTRPSWPGSMTARRLGECRVAAIESLGDLKPNDKRITQFLVAGMEHDEPAIRVASWNALKSITGKDLGVEANEWKKVRRLAPRHAPCTASTRQPAPASP